MKADVDLNVNPNEARDSRWVSQEDLKTMFQDKSLKLLQMCMKKYAMLINLTEKCTGCSLTRIFLAEYFKTLHKICMELLTMSNSWAYPENPGVVVRHLVNNVLTPEL
jgi:hypothetical protein